ncbi:bacteriocin-like protein [Chryseobacterium indoltheticum]|uniref:bacteriocin-like protein n=1 Tax=Chryseobacterium indoltheticum TaxID=254 RepID=UPI0040425064
MTKLKKLSRNDLRNVTGGQSCTLSIQGSDGKWVTRKGVCKVSVTLTQVTDDLSIPSATSYCETGLGQVNVTSNGGNSRCGS